MGKILILINQAICGCLIDAKQLSNTLFINSSTELKKQIENWDSKFWPIGSIFKFFEIH